jgi:2-C-methyl-D-erythritol 4-phosphate cytidylyltransferase
MRTVAVVLAGGTGLRFGSAVPKQLQLLGGTTVLERSVRAFSTAPDIDDVLVVTAAELAGQVRDRLRSVARLADVIAGGTARSDSTQCALSWLAARAEAARPGEDWKVLFHDAARPLVDQPTITACVAALDSWDAVGVVVPSADTIVELAGGTFQRILPRESLARCQTPQGFRLSVISRAYELAAADEGFGAMPPTDDCGVVLRYLPDVPVGAVKGSERNIKITYAADLAIAQALIDLGEAGA